MEGADCCRVTGHQEWWFVAGSGEDGLCIILDGEETRTWHQETSEYR